MLLDKLSNIFIRDSIIHIDNTDPDREERHKEELKRAERVRAKLEEEMDRRIELLKAELRAERIRTYYERD